ncbi:four helix bundle protein [candidate division WWE3 bacterium]|uniref:Four helix bundle protein n=1 Tax=candidate division WWE3 bacterium TaxID=2053526 RepID=A0A3A4ZNA5_UNCKA|nr:MAG: four helix bundle protein [candidate division WWE3 bacterium]
MFSYQKLDIYQIAKDIVKRTYTITRMLPSSEQYGLISQMNRAAISIPSNIAESSGRHSKKDKAQFISISFASLMELTCQAEIALELEYIDSLNYEEFIKACKDLSVRLSNYRKYLFNS